MVKFVFSPEWFQGIDVAFIFLSLGITALISLYCYFCYYKVCENKQYKYFSYAFFAIAFSFFLKILANITIIYDTVIEQKVGALTFTTTLVTQSKFLVIFGKILHHFFFLLGLLMLFIIIYKQRDKYTITLLTFLVLVISVFSTSAFFVFVLTAAAISGLIFMKYWKNFRLKRKKNALLLALAFLMIFIGQLLFMALIFSRNLYPVAETIQLFGFILLLLTFISVVRKHDTTNKT